MKSYMFSGPYNVVFISCFFQVRRALGDFGMPIAILIMVLLDLSVHDTFTQKLDVPTGLQVKSMSKFTYF